MFHSILKISLLVLLMLGGAYGLYCYEQRWSQQAKLQEQVRILEARKQHLEKFISLLTSEKRVAEIVVTEQTLKGGQIDTTTLMFVESDRDGKRLPPRFFTIKGNVAHIDALVIKFDRSLMENGDALRGHSIVLFHRIFGDYQAPVDAFPIDDPGKAPAVYTVDSPSGDTKQYEAELWRDFWLLADDAKLRQERGVRVAQGEGPWMPFNPDRIYTLSLEASGGLSIVPRPLDGLLKDYIQAIKQQRPS